MNFVPDDVYDHVSDLCTRMANATAKGDADTNAVLFKELADYCSLQERKGGQHPFLLETLGDFSLEPSDAVEWYRKALHLSRQTQLQEGTILVSMGESLLEMGQSTEARKCFQGALHDAQRLDDRETLKKAEEALALLDRGLGPKT